MHKKNIRVSPYSIVLKYDFKSETYRVSQKLFKKIQQELASYRSITPPTKQIRCIETGIIFSNARKVTDWLIKKGITKNYAADIGIKCVCKGQKESAYGYHWEFVEPHDKNFTTHSQKSHSAPA